MIAQKAAHTSIPAITILIGTNKYKTLILKPLNTFKAVPGFEPSPHLLFSSSLRQKDKFRIRKTKSLQQAGFNQSGS
ncbi:MAG: hypothetical protein IE913_00210 [Halothiobacillus sp.]|nr:hypothetical protein [Halothiobacillus sp.]